MGRGPVHDGRSVPETGRTAQEAAAHGTPGGGHALAGGGRRRRAREEETGTGREDDGRRPDGVRRL